MQKARVVSFPDAANTRSRLLDSVVHITGQRNFDDIRFSLVNTVFELLPACALQAYKLSGSSKQTRLNELLIAERDAQGEMEIRGLGARGLKPSALQQLALETRRPQQQEGRGQILDCFPVVSRGEVVELLVTRLPAGRMEDVPMLRALMRLYTNILDLMLDKEIDTLTNVLNRRAFDNQLDGLLRQPRASCGTSALDRNAHCWWLVMVDADNFKAINDTYGHLIGDEVLLLLARMMTRAFRVTDRVFRYGGEEFAIILAPSSRADAIAAVERFRDAVDHAHFPQVEHVTTSAGLVAIDRYDHPASVIDRADRALYQAKRAGRNQVCEFASLRDSGLIDSGDKGHELELF